jgi:hypothetical protein
MVLYSKRNDQQIEEMPTEWDIHSVRDHYLEYLKNSKNWNQNYTLYNQ